MPLDQQQQLQFKNNVSEHVYSNEFVTLKGIIQGDGVSEQCEYQVLYSKRLIIYSKIFLSWLIFFCLKFHTIF